MCRLYCYYCTPFASPRSKFCSIFSNCVAVYPEPACRQTGLSKGRTLLRSVRYSTFSLILHLLLRMEKERCSKSLINYITTTSTLLLSSSGPHPSSPSPKETERYLVSLISYSTTTSTFFSLIGTSEISDRNQKFREARAVLGWPSPSEKVGMRLQSSDGLLTILITPGHCSLMIGFNSSFDGSITTCFILSLLHV
jgi:hypothetical protein